MLLNAAALLVLSVFLYLVNNSGTTIFLIDAVWGLVLFLFLCAEYFSRKKYFSEIMTVLGGLPQRYLIAEVMKPGYRLEDKLYWEILRKSNKSVIEEIHKLECSQKEYKEYIESWIHEVKTPITAIRLICGNHKEEFTKNILFELDGIENEVEKVLYYVRMEQVYQDYLIHPVHLREVVLSAIRAEKRHFIQCRMQIDLDMPELSVPTDEKWAEFIIKQIFSNSMKYRRETGARIKIYAENREKQKSLVIEDNGCGISEEEIGRIFEKGFTGKNGRLKNNNATGIGLYICRRLCEKLRMGIFCESEAGSYTRIILTFPDTDYNRF